MTERYQRRRKRLLVEKDFQYRFTLRICLANGFLFVIFVGALLFILKSNYEMLTEEALRHNMPEAARELREEYRILTVGIAASLISLLLILFGIGLFLTQKIAGPLTAIRKRLAEVADGKEGVRLYLRENDEFKNIQYVFNEAMEKQEKRIQDLREEMAKK